MSTLFDEAIEAEQGCALVTLSGQQADTERTIISCVDFTIPGTLVATTICEVLMDDTLSFGRWLQQRRKQLDLTQAELGRQVGVSGDAIRKIEGEERRPSKEVAEHLARLLHIPPEEQPVFIRFARGEAAVFQSTPLPATVEQSPWQPQPRPLSNLPMPPTSLLGREQELALACALLHRPDICLVTLTGPGGIGKTRLGIEIAEAVRDAFRDGVFFVPLAPIRNSEFVISAIAQVIGVKETAGQPLLDAVQRYLRDKHLLLLLDNFEHIIAAAPGVSTLLAQAHHLKVLVTSREPLRLAGEQEFPVPPLRLPALVPLPPLPLLSQYDAVALFIRRAQAVLPSFQITNTNGPAVAEICHRLDGLPLALELAAARVKLLPVSALLARLGSRLAVLSGGARDLPTRHQTLRATIDWSYHLLLPAEQVVFARLGVFVGGCTLEAVDAVCGTGDRSFDALDTLQSLVDKSLVRVAADTDTRPRFTMLETIREYAVEQLQARDDKEDTYQRHAAYYVQFVERAERELVGPEQVQWLNHLAVEHDNIRHALGWAVAQHASETAARLSGIMVRFWWAHGLLSEGRRWLEDVLAISDELEPFLRGLVLRGLGILAAFQADFSRAQVVLEENLELHQRQADPQGMVLGVTALGLLASMEGRYSDAVAYYQQSLTWSRQAGDLNGIARDAGNLGIAYVKHGELGQGQDLLEESLALYREVGNPGGIAHAVTSLGDLAMAQGHYDRALLLFRESLALHQALNLRMFIASNLQALGDIAAAQSKPVRAARFWGAAEVLLESTGASLKLAAYDRVDYREKARAQLGEVAFTQAWNEGRGMPVEEAVELALKSP